MLRSGISNRGTRSCSLSDARFERQINEETRHESRQKRVRDRFTFEEGSAGGPFPIKKWFYPGYLGGEEFIYSSHSN
jgi:hypothetical protein